MAGSRAIRNRDEKQEVECASRLASCSCPFLQCHKREQGQEQEQDWVAGEARLVSEPYAIAQTYATGDGPCSRKIAARPWVTC